MRNVLLALTVVMALALSACGTGGGYYLDYYKVTAVTVTPASPAPGELALLDFTLATGQHFMKSSWSLPAMSHPPELETNAGEVFPLSPAVYRPGGPLPELAAAQGETERLRFAANLDEFVQHGHCYVLLAAPAAPQTVTVRLHTGFNYYMTPDGSERTVAVAVGPPAAP